MIILLFSYASHTRTVKFLDNALFCVHMHQNSFAVIVAKVTTTSRVEVSGSLFIFFLGARVDFTAVCSGAVVRLGEILSEARPQHRRELAGSHEALPEYSFLLVFSTVEISSSANLSALSLNYYSKRERRS